MRSAFGKTFTYYIFILLISSFLLSLGFIQIFRGYFYSDQKNALLNQALKISDIYKNLYLRPLKEIRLEGYISLNMEWSALFGCLPY